MKKTLLLLLCCILLLPLAAQATIYPAAGVDKTFLDWTGISCEPAVVLCESLSICDARGDQGGKTVATLRYSEDNATIPVIEHWDGWAQIYYEDGTKTGWVRSDYLLFDPAWYLCDADLQVYAYDDFMAPRVAWLPKGTVLPIIRDLEGWVQVSLRGATGYIRKTPADTVAETWFRPELLADLAAAALTLDGETLHMVDPEPLATLAELLTNVRDNGGLMAGCPFTATLALTTRDGQVIEVQLATDSCCVYRVDGRDYSYARNLYLPDDAPDNTCLFDLFGVYPGQG